MKVSNQKRSMGDVSTELRRITAIAALGLIALTLPVHAGSTGATNLYMPQGDDAGTANGDYITATGGLDTFYSYFIEVPPNLSRLVVELFDADVMDGGGGELAAQRDRQRGGSAASDFTYTLLNPSGATVSTFLEDDGVDNAWFTILDSLTTYPAATAPAFESASSANKGNAGTTLSITAPNNIDVGDFLVAVVARGDSGTNMNPATGWTELDEQECNNPGGDGGCRFAVYYKVAVGTEDLTAQVFDVGMADEAAGSILVYTGVELADPFNGGTNPNAGTGTSAVAQTITTTTANTRVLRFFAAGGAAVTVGTPTNGNGTAQTGRSTDTNIGGVGVRESIFDQTLAAAGATGDATSTLSTSSPWGSITFALRGIATIPNGHWELRVDSSSGDELNALGIRAHDGTSGSGGVEIPIYYDSHTQFGVNPDTDPTSRNYDVFPWVTNGCQGVVSTFDFDANNGGTQGAVGLTSPVSLPGGSSYTTTVNDAALSGNDVWVRNTFGPWTTDSRSTRYGLWRADVNIQTYNPGALNGNYTNVYFAPSTQPADPPGQPEVGVYRVYLPTDVSDTTMPVKPYIEQLITWLGGPNPPATNTQSDYRVTIRVVNPTTRPIVFSTPNNIVTANVPGSGATYGGLASASQGTVISTPAIGGTGNITWDPGTIAAGNGDATIDNAEVALLHYAIRITPTAAGQRVVATGTVALNGTRAQYLDETANASQTRATYLQGPLCELAITQGVSTKALVTDLRAVEERGQVAVEWTTTTEDGTTGYDLYRWSPSAESWERVNRDLVMAAPDSIQGGHYRVVDAGAPAGQELSYALMEVETKGSVRTAGTFTAVPQSAGSDKSVFAGDRMVERVAVGKAQEESARLSAAAVRAAAAESAELEPFAAGVRPRPTGSRLRIGVPQAGLYRLAAVDIAARFGVTPATAEQWIASGQIKLERQGQVVPTFRNGGDGSAAYFYARPFESLYSATDVYWLSLTTGANMATGAVAGAPAGGETFFDRKTFEVDAFAATVVTTDPESDYWYWEYLVGDSVTEGQRSFQLQLADPVAKGNAELTVRLYGATDTGIADEHHAEVRVNGNTVGQTSWQGIAAHEDAFSFPASFLTPGANTVDVVATTGSGAPYSVYYVDGFELASPRRLRAEGLRLEFAAGTTSALQVSGFRGNGIALVDVTNPAAPQWTSGGTVSRTSNGFGITFQPASSASRYVAESLSAIRTPASMVLDTPSNLRASNGAQYLVITDDELAAGAASLASYRAGQGLSTQVVKIQDVYDEFGSGLAGPHALRDFLAYAWNEWPTAPRYVTLVGEGTYDYRNLGGLGGNKIPALMVATADGLFSSDAGYGDVDDDGVVEMAVGRLPVLSPAELAGVVAKIQAYESLGGAWIDQALFIADNLDGATNFAAESDQLYGALAPGFSLGKIYLDLVSPAVAHDAVVSALQSGTNYVQYIGHGGLDRFADESVLANGDVAALSNGGRAPIVAALTCAVNRFELPDYPALGEVLVRKANGGATAVFAPSGLGQHGSAREFAGRLTAALYRAETPRLGDALVAAQQAYVGAGGDAELLRIYNLLGDPALRMRTPTPVPSVPGPPSGE